MHTPHANSQFVSCLINKKKGNLVYEYLVGKGKYKIFVLYTRYKNFKMYFYGLNWRLT